MKRRTKVGGAIGGGLTILVTLVACAGITTGDRTSGSGTQADSYQDARHVTVYNNADNVPNVAVFCLGPYGWASTLSGTDAGENKSAVLVRFESYDKTCAT
jgi:hypothetical protein